MMPPFELPSQFSEDPLEEPSFAQVAGAGTVGSGVASLVDVPTSGFGVSSSADGCALAQGTLVLTLALVVVLVEVLVEVLVRGADSADVIAEVVVVVGATEDSGAGSTSVVVGEAVRGADTFGASEVEDSAEGWVDVLDEVTDVVSVVRGVDGFGASEVEDLTDELDEVTDVDEATVVVGVVVRGADTFGASGEVVVDTSGVVGTGATEVVTDVGAAEEGTSVVVGVGSFASSSSRFSCASTTRKKVRSSSACALLISGA